MRRSDVTTAAHASSALDSRPRTRRGREGALAVYAREVEAAWTWRACGAGARLADRGHTPRTLPSRGSRRLNILSGAEWWMEWR